MLAPHHRRLLLFLALVAHLASCRLAEKGSADLRLRVLDPQGVPVTEAQGLVLVEPPFSSGAWVSSEGGALVLSVPEPWPPPGACQVLVRAREFTLWRSPLEEVSRPEQVVVLSPGRKLELVLSTGDDRALPESLTPTVFDPGFAGAAWDHREPDGTRISCYPVAKYGSRSFLVSAPAGPTELYVLVDEPGFLRGFQAGPITDPMIATGQLEIPLPAPAVVVCRIERGADPGESTGLCVEVRRQVQLPGAGRRAVLVQLSDVPDGSSELVFADLAPGSYSFTIVALEAPALSAEGEPPAGSRQRLEVDSAASYELVLTAP